MASIQCNSVTGPMITAQAYARMNGKDNRQGMQISGKVAGSWPVLGKAASFALHASSRAAATQEGASSHPGPWEPPSDPLTPVHVSVFSLPEDTHSIPLN